MAQSEAAFRAWAKIYAKRGEKKKAAAMRAKLKRLQRGKKLSRSQRELQARHRAVKSGKQVEVYDPKEMRYILLPRGDKRIIQVGGRPVYGPSKRYLSSEVEKRLGKRF